MAAGPLSEQSAEQIVSATRRIDGKVLGSLWVGVGIGVAVGFYIGYRYSKKKIHAEILEESEREIAEVREYYRQKIAGVEAKEKPTAEKIVQDRGYATHSYPPLETQRPLRPPVPVSPSRQPTEEVQTSIDPPKRSYRMSIVQKDKNEDWNYVRELAHRSTPDGIYVIHQDEFELNESGYQQTTYIYYTEDDVLIDEDDPKTILSNRENLIGSSALTRFGHGADDYNLVHVRNTKLELEFEIFRFRGSWEQEVMGLDDNASH